MALPTAFEIRVFIDAAGTGNLTAVTAFLDKVGAKYVNARDAGGTTALINASFRGRRQVVEFLLNRGADINAKNDDGNTALMAAAWHNRLEVVEVLLDRGASCNQVNNGGFTELELARRHGCEEAARVLIGVGAVGE